MKLIEYWVKFPPAHIALRALARPAGPATTMPGTLHRDHKSMNDADVARESEMMRAFAQQFGGAAPNAI